MAKNISNETTAKTANMAIAPAMGGYDLFQKSGRHGSVRETKAVGRRWMKAVAMRTPVPKCRERKRK